jgi:CubicO group peptidase (beta-lactamase class C family)
MLLARAAGEAAGGGREAALAFMRRELFEPLGIRSAVPEFDAAGSFLGGGFVWMTARDWARFGLLYLRDGVWGAEGNGASVRRILPEGWVDFSRSAAPAPNNTTFGAHLWRNVAPAPDQFPRLLPDGPDSVFSAQGAYGQLVVMVPTHDLVIVRLGELDGYDFTALTPLLAEILASFPPL